jgi:TatD DNase family protein
MLQDAHIHLTDGGEEAEKILSDAAGLGVGRFFCNSACPSDWPKVRRLSELHDGVIPFFGVHPWYAEKVPEGWEEELLKYLAEDRARIGEIGLDAAKKDISFAKQREVFARQLEIAMELKKPFAIH